MSSKTIELARECQRQYDNCLYTAVSLQIWLRWLRTLKVCFNIAPIALGSLGSWRILAQSTDSTTKTIGALASFIGGLLSTIYSALKLDTHIAEARVAAAELTNLRDGFRQAALVWSTKSFDEFEAEFLKLRGRLEKVRNVGLTPPNVCFKLAQRKIRSGDYHFDIDDETRSQALPEATEAKPQNLLSK